MEKSDAEQVALEETSNIDGIFDDTQPMTYEDVEQVEDPTQGSQTVVTNYDDNKKQEPSDDNLPESVKAYRELQSKYDKEAQLLKQLKEENETFKTQMEELNMYKPIIRYLEENPEVFDRIASTNEGPNTNQQTPNVQEELKEPERPRDYDAFAAYNDPDSESFKYREKMDEYRMRKMEMVEANIERKKQEYEEMIAKKEQEVQQRLAEQELNRVLARDFQMNEGERKRFIEFSSNPNPSLDVLVNVFRAINSKNTAVPPQEETPVGKNFKTIVDAPGTTSDADKMTDDQLFTTGLASRRTNLFD